jgi:hypothetical protein
MTATNNVGWEVQQLTAGGWISITNPCPDSEKHELERLAAELNKIGAHEYRVYESLK